MTTSSTAKNVPVYQPRNYQLEMFEASMKENIIVAMDTGSGKTNIALLRIKGELESGSPGKLIWFLAPTVALCGQQHKVITDNIPAVRTRTLTGADKVELWTDQTIWDGVLKGMQVVVSTFAVLADAMTHGFVRISQLGLIIFDEAHHCMRRHPANKIMQEFYHPTLARLGRGAVPRIMGLTASPVVRSNQIDLRWVQMSRLCIWYRH
ncbi:Dicer-like protein 2 [Aspergillus melleus]|uniref:Dicer-like protein 2 n=1 Tax=Aspergillus melleus TaxID=138277 RepID=UPI001E8CF1FD|nr:Dicer-like protein 2 [Aspergillus melleus]KAH8433815.1 Dicer-like protein 2 [Aspergillus melleus]